MRSEEKKTAQVVFRLSESDRKTLEQYARDAGKRLSAFIRSQAFKVAGDQKVKALQLPDGMVIPTAQLERARFIIYPDPEEVDEQ